MDPEIKAYKERLERTIAHLESFNPEDLSPEMQTLRVKAIAGHKLLLHRLLHPKPSGS